MSKIINFEFYYLFIIFLRFITSTFMAGGTTVRLSRVGVFGYSLCNLTKRVRENENKSSVCKCSSNCKALLPLLLVFVIVF